MVWIPGGEFSMGAADPMGADNNDVGMHATTDSRPIHRVYIDGLWMDATEVTNAPFAAARGDDFRHEGHWMTNTHQGHFPDRDSGEASEP